MAKKDQPKEKRVPSRLAGRTTIQRAERKAYPGIYANPRDILAESVVAPESPALLDLFGVTRAELAQTAAREGSMSGSWPGMAASPNGARSAKRVMGQANTQRLIDLLGEARDTPLGEGMRGWYVMDPLYQRLAEVASEEGVDPQEALRLSRDLNAYSAMASPGSDVITETRRGSAANALAQQGRLDEFLRYGGKEGRSKDPLMAGVPGHPYHSTAHGKPMLGYSRAGEMTVDTPKVSLYEQASRNPALGFQTDSLVGDAHWSRGVGLADTRTGSQFAASYTGSEAQTLIPWWQDIARAVDLQPVPAQATLWGLLARQTGVDTPVGAPKLELIADQIMKAARRERADPRRVRDDYLLGRRQIGSASPRAMAAMAAGGAGLVALNRMLGLADDDAVSDAPTVTPETLDRLAEQPGSAVGNIRTAASTPAPMPGIEPYEPTRLERMQGAIADRLPLSDNYRRQRTAEGLTGLLDFSPAAAAKTLAVDAPDAYAAGDDWLGRLLLGTAAVEAVPMVGPPAARAARAAARNVWPMASDVPPEVAEFGRSVPGYHYSRADAPMRRMEGAQHGTGSRGQEAERMTDDLRDRTYYYAEGSRPQPDRATPRPEPVVQAGPTYRVMESGMYDVRDNPLGLPGGSEMERQLKQRGFSGYYDPDTGIAVALQPSTEGVRVGGFRAEAEEALERAGRLPDQPYRVTAENLPSTETDMGRWLASQPQALRERYTDEVEGLLDRNQLMRELGVRDYAQRAGYGTYEGATNPNTIIDVATPEEAQLVANARGLLTQQDAVPFFRQDAQGPVAGVRVSTDRAIPPGLLDYVHSTTGQDLTRSDINQIELLNFFGDDGARFSGLSDDEWAARLGEFFGGRRGVTDVNRFQAQSDYNWTQDLWRAGGDDGGGLLKARPVLGELQKQLARYNERFRQQHGSADPRALAILAALGAGGAALAPRETEEAAP